MTMLQIDNPNEPPHCHCNHLDHVGNGFLAVINIAGENSTVFDDLPKCYIKDVCIFNLNNTDSQLTTLLENHKAVLLLDSTHNGKAPGTISIIDLGALIRKHSASPVISSNHGPGLLKELRNLEEKQALPNRIVLLAVETDEESQTNTRIKNLSQLICKAAEALKRECKT